jgi:hypothetical protein
MNKQRKEAKKAAKKARTSRAERQEQSQGQPEPSAAQISSKYRAPVPTLTIVGLRRPVHTVPQRTHSDTLMTAAITPISSAPKETPTALTISLPLTHLTSEQPVYSECSTGSYDTEYSKLAADNWVTNTHQRDDRALVQSSIHPHFGPAPDCTSNHDLLPSDDIWKFVPKFLVDSNGTISLVNRTNWLYDIETQHDDGTSDFDSEASPVKVNLLETTFSDADSSDDLSDYSEADKLVGERLNNEHYETGAPAVHEKALDISFGAVEHVIDESLDIEPSSERSLFERKNSYEGLSGIAMDENAVASTKQASNGTCKLTRMLLESESLFTFSKVLEAKQNGKATRKAIVTAFLALIDLERKKRKKLLLPSACCATIILRSEILQHMTTLGAIRIVALLTQLDFNEEDEVATMDLYKTFDKLTKKQMQMHREATSGTVRVLGRALGRLT